MNSIVRELDARLQTLDGITAAALERVVRDAIDLASRQQTPLTTWPEGFFARIRDEWGEAPFDRPPQGEQEIREDW